MHILHKISYGVGLGAGITLFALLLFSAIPDTINNSAYIWNEMERDSLDRKKILQEIEAFESVKMFKEMYPNATDYFDEYDIWYEVVISDFEINQKLRLYVSYDNNDHYYEEIKCMSLLDNVQEYRFTGATMMQYIKENSCLVETLRPYPDGFD